MDGRRKEGTEGNTKICSRSRPAPEQIAFLRRRACGFAERHSGPNGCATVRLGVDRKPASDKFYSLRHADETKALRFESPFTVKSSPRIVYSERNRIWGTTQLDIEVPHAAMFNGVLQGLLRDSEEAQRNILGERSRDVIMIKDDFDILLIGELMAESSHGRGNA